MGQQESIFNIPLGAFLLGGASGKLYEVRWSAVPFELKTLVFCQKSIL